jgi:SAM-dependent methyltransferase
MQQRSVDSVRLQDIAYAYRHSAVLIAAVELGLFTLIAQGVDTIPRLATALDITPTNAERLLMACAALGLVVPDGEHFTNAADVQKFLVKGEKGYAGPWILMARADRDQWSRLAEYLRSKEPPRLLGMYETFTVEDARRLHEATYSIGMGAGRRFVRHVDLLKRRRILDLGGGSGCYCIAAAQAHPNIRGIVLDLPPVAEVTREFIAQHGLSDRIEAQAGDFTRDPFPNDVDVVIMASNLPQYSREVVQQVVRKAYDALLPGGEMHLIGEMLRNDHKGPIGPALWALNEALYGSTGVAHSAADAVGYLERAGFVDVAAHEFIPGSLTRVSGTKPRANR